MSDVNFPADVIRIATTLKYFRLKDDILLVSELINFNFKTLTPASFISILNSQSWNQFCNEIFDIFFVYYQVLLSFSSSHIRLFKASVPNNEQIASVDRFKMFRLQIYHHGRKEHKPVSWNIWFCATGVFFALTNSRNTFFSDWEFIYRNIYRDSETLIKCKLPRRYEWNPFHSK